MSRGGRLIWGEDPNITQRKHQELKNAEKQEDDRLEALLRLPDENRELRRAVRTEQQRVRSLTNRNERLVSQAERALHRPTYQRYLNRATKFAHDTHTALNGEEPSLVIAHDTLALAAAATVAGDAPVIYDAVETPHLGERSGTMSDRYRKDPLGLEIITSFEHRIASRADAILTVAPSLGGWISNELGVQHVTVVQNCREMQEIARTSDLRKQCRLDDDDVLLLYLNSIYPGSGFDVALEAMLHLPPNFHLAVVGAPPREDHNTEIEAKVAELGVADRVHFTGPVGPESLVQHISGADISVVPLSTGRLNLRFAMPNRIFESIMAGVPLAVTAGGDMAALVDKYQLGTTFEEANAQDMAKQLLALDHRRRTAKFHEDFAAARTELSWEEESKQFCDVVASLMIDQSGPAVILANKSIQTNDRIRRMAKSLVLMGLDTVVICRSGPAKGLVESGVRYIELGT